MSLASKFSSLHVGVQAAFVAGSLGVAAAVITGGFALAGVILTGNHNPAPAGGSHSGTPCAPGVQITSPNSGISVNGNDGIEVTGTWCAVGANSAWLFDWDSQDHYYYFDYSGNNPVPLTLSADGKWRFNDSPIGDPGDNQKEYVITLVYASPACSQSLLQAPEQNGTYRLSSFPPGCEIAGQRLVYVTYP